ncbi:sulfatase [candidate division KSB1 bacterium]|nr:sulfatase [candidate division KSB1 bacterium]
MPSHQPNIIFIICHDLGQQLGCYQAGISTPNLDALSRAGVKFENCFCSAAQCSPSRGSVMTGKSPHANGLMGLAHIGWEIDSDVKKLPTYLGDAGYETHLFGVQHESAHAETLGYNVVHTCGRNAKAATDGAIHWLKEISNQKSADQRPFFISLGFEEPHRPYPHDASEYAIDDWRTVQPLPYLPDVPEIRKDIAGLNGLIHRVDESVGRLLHALDELQLRENTLVIFTTDHGIAMPRAKGTCYDPGIRIALLMHLPQRFEGGMVYRELISNVDFLPTLVEFAGGTIPGTIEGRSFLPLLNRQSFTARTHIFCEMSWHDRYNPMRAVRTERYKYIRNFGDRPLVYIPADIFKGSAGIAVRDQFYAQRRPAEEVYDLARDPWEMNNLIEEPDTTIVVKELRRLVDEWMEKTEDPLLQGPITPTQKQRERELTDPLPNA